MTNTHPTMLETMTQPQLGPRSWLTCPPLASKILDEDMPDSPKCLPVDPNYNDLESKMATMAKQKKNCGVFLLEQQNYATITPKNPVTSPMLWRKPYNSMKYSKLTSKDIVDETKLKSTIP